MNKGKNLAKANLIHYLNAGDEVTSDIYINQPCLLPVKIIDKSGGSSWFDKPEFLDLHVTKVWFFLKIMNLMI